MDCRDRSHLVQRWDRPNSEFSALQFDVPDREGGKTATSNGWQPADDLHSDKIAAGGAPSRQRLSVLAQFFFQLIDLPLQPARGSGIHQHDPDRDGNKKHRFGHDDEGRML